MVVGWNGMDQERSRYYHPLQLPLRKSHTGSHTHTLDWSVADNLLLITACQCGQYGHCLCVHQASINLMKLSSLSLLCLLHQILPIPIRLPLLLLLSSSHSLRILLIRAFLYLAHFSPCLMVKCSNRSRLTSQSDT